MKTFLTLLLLVLISRLDLVGQGKQKPGPPMPTEFQIGRLTFFDFGPPNEYYELILVKGEANGTSVERVLLTPPGDACLQTAKIEASVAHLNQPVASLFGKTNPCSISQKDLNRELKRCKKCLTFSGVKVAMQVSCGGQDRIIRSDILDRDMFDAAPNTPPHTSWTMQLLQELDKALGPGAMDKPVFQMAESQSNGADVAPEWTRDIASGKYDGLFASGDTRPSLLYRMALAPAVEPTSVTLTRIAPEEAGSFRLPVYPPLAKVAHVQGDVEFSLEVDAYGRAKSIVLESGHPMLKPAVQDAVTKAKFDPEMNGRTVKGTISFRLNCRRG